MHQKGYHRGEGFLLNTRKSISVGSEPIRVLSPRGLTPRPHTRRFHKSSSLILITT